MSDFINPWDLNKNQEEEEVKPKKSWFSDIFDNAEAYAKAAYANTRELGMGQDIKGTFDKIYNREYSDSDEKARLVEDLQRLQNERNEYRNMFQENQEVLNQNDSMLKDFTEVGGTLQGIGTQAKDTLIGMGTGAAVGSAVPVLGTSAGAMAGAKWGNRIGAVHQAINDADMNAIDAWEKVLNEGGTPDQAEQAYKDAFWNNMPTEASDILSSLYFGGKLTNTAGNILNRALGGKLAGAITKGAQKVSRFDLPAKVGTNVAKKFGSTAGKIAGGVTASALEGVGEAVQEPWQDYATERAIDIQRRQYDPNHEGIRDFSVLGDGGLLDYYTTPEGRETAWKSFKMGAAFGGIGSALSASQFTELGTANNDSITAGKQLASEFSEGGELFGTDVNYDDVRKMMGNIYGLTEDERDSLSKEDVYRMYVDYWTNKYSSGGLFSTGNRQEVNAVMQADLINALTGQETNRTDQLNDYSRRYVDKYALNPDNSIFNDIKQQQAEQLNQEEQVQEAVEDSEQRNGEDVAMTGKFKEGNFSPETSKEAKERNGGVLGSNEGNQSVKKSEWYDLPDKFGKQWVWADDGMDSDDNRTYRNTETGRLANVERVKVGKKGKYNRYTYRVKDITNGRNDPNTIGVGGYAGVGDRKRNNEFTNVKQVEKYLNLPRTNRDTSFMADSQHGNEQGGIKQALPQEDGVIASKDIQKDAEGNEVYNGRVIQSKDAFTVHSMDDLDTYFREHGDLMSTDLYAEVARGMMRFGIGKDNKTSIVLDLANDKSGALGSKTTWMENPNDPNSAIAKAVIRLYAGADLVTAAHEIAHLGWINLSDQDKNTFARWAIDTEEEFVARVLGYQYDNNFRAYLLEALTNQGEGGSLDSQALWQKIKEQGATKQTIDILNNHANDQNIADAIDERFAWEFSNWFAQGYIKGEKPHNVIERILQKACQSMGDALRLLYDTDRYLNDKNYRLGASGRDVADIFNRISASRKDRGQQMVMPQQEEPVSLRTEMRQPVEEAPYNLGQGFDEVEYTTLDENPTQNLGKNTGTITGTSPVATTPITQEEDPEPKKKRSKEHKEWEKRQQEKKEAQEKAIKNARDNVKAKLNNVKDLYNKKASVEDLTKAVDELYGAAMSAKDLSTEKEHTDLIKDALKKVSQFRSKIDELRKKKPQTVKYTPPMTKEEESQYLTPDDVYNYIGVLQTGQPTTPIATGTPATSPEEQYMSNIINGETGQQEQPTKPTRKDFSSPQWGDQYGEDELLGQILNNKEGMTKTQGIEGLQKQNAEKLKKDIKSNIDKANKSLNAKNSKLSLEDVSKLISNAEESLNKYKDMDSAYYDEKTAGEFGKAIETLKKKLEEKKENGQKEGGEQISQVVKTGFTSTLNTIKPQTINGAALDQINQNYNKNQKMLKEQEVITQAIDNIEKAINQHVNARDISNQIAAVEWEILNYTNKGYEQSDFVKKSYDRLIELQKKLVVEKERQEEEKKKRKEQEKIQNILNKVKNVDELEGLSDEAKIVYYETKEILDKKGSSEVRPLAHENAVLFARICERIAQMYKQAKVDYAKDGSPVTAKTIADNITLKPDSLDSRTRGSYSLDTDMTNHSDVEKVTYLTSRVIKTTRYASPSTFLHETTHMYAFEMQYLSQIAPNSQAAKDYRALMKWAGFTDINKERTQAKQLTNKKNIKPYLDNVEFSTGHNKDVGTLWYKHEKIAIAFEEYLRTGKVPSPKLKGVFARLKQWILNFFNDLKTLSIKPTDEIQSIFDRMILTDEELKEINSGQEQGNKETTSSKTETENQNNKNSKTDELIAKLDKKYKKISITGIRKLYPFNKREKEDIQFWIGQIREALVNGKDLSQFDKRIHQHTIDNVGTPNWEVRDVEKYVTNYLNDAKKIQQEINKIKSVSEVNQSDTKMQSSSKEEIAKNRKPTLWSISKTGGKTAIRRSKFGVGKDVSGQIYFHKDYAEDVIDADTLKKARDIAHREGFTEDKYNCMMYDTHTGVVRFDEAPDFDTSREPITGKYLRVYPDGHTERSKGGANQERQIWHHKWLWVKEDYKGFDVQASRDWSEKWLEANKGQGRPSGKKSEWDKKLKDIGLGKYIEDTKMQVESTEGLEQDGSSAGTSRKQVAAMFKKINWEKGTINADIGGGKYDLMTEYVKEKGVENIVFDPGNRTLEHNRQAVEKIQHRVDTATVANVLNVLPSIKDMKNVILQAAECLKPNGKAYFLMYEGDGKNKNKLTEVKKGQWQQNKPQKWYRPLLEERFGKENVKFKDGFYTCTNPIIKKGEKGVWSLDDTFKDNNVTLTYDNADTKSQVASKNAQNQTRLNAKSEQVLEKLFRRLVRDKKITDAPWNKGNIDRLKKYTNIADKGTPRDLKLNPNDKRTMDAEYLDALQKVNDYLHEKYPYLKNIYRGADGHWRFEFSDKDAQLVDGLDEREKVTTLGKVLKHDNLYKFYPKLKNMHVSIVSNERMNRIMGDNPNSEYDGAYDPTSKYIYLNKDSFKEEDMRKVLLHEVQHAIQDIEGLANGDSAFNEENYETSAGEREANQTEERANMSDEELQNNPRKTNPKEKTVLSDVRAITDTKMQEKSTPITRTQLLQDLANLTRGSAIELNAITVHDEMSKQYMREQMAERGFTEKEAEDLIKDLEKIADEVVEIAKDHPYMQSWQNRGKVIHNEDGTVKEIIPNRVEDKDGKLGWLPVRNAFRSNGEYKVNMDLGTLCMKREAFDALMQIAVKEGFGKNLGISQIEGLKEVLKKYKYATACDVCYVETRRARMLQYANNVSYDWDSVLMALDLDDGNKLGSVERDFKGIIKKDGVEYTQQQILDMMTSTEEDENGVKQYVKAFNMFVPDDRKRVKKNPKDNKSPDLDTGTTADKMYKIAKLFKEDSTLAGWFNPDLLLTSSIENGTGYLACNYGGHTNIINTLGGLDSQNTPKPIESFIVYDPLSWKDANGLSENQLMRMLGTKEIEVTNEDGTKEIRTVVDVERAAESLYDIGGGRLQAFSDFNPILFLDYCQLIADYAARRMPIHAYTKVPALVELFGETRMMINMSLLPEIVDGVDADHLGLKKNPKTGEWEYAWHKDSFPPELAFEYRKRKQYEGHAGIIAIGISKEHIIKMMADPEIDMIIPYHKSGMAKGVQIKTLLERATDYTKTQTMKYPKYPKDQGGKSREAEIKAKIKADTGINGDVYLNYSRVLFTVGDPRKAAKEYVRRCEKYGCTPAFDEFKNYDGYYKLLEDFRGYDNNGNPVLQEAARFKLPDNWNEILKKQLSAREKMIKYKESMAQNEALLRDMRKVFTPQRIDGEIKERMITALRKIFKYDSSVSREQKNKIKEIYPTSWRDKYSNVRCLPQQAFLDELEKEYQKNMSAEEAAKAVEVYRRRDGIVYGFSRGKSIFLNEDYMNANTPAHEFTHIWAKIAQAANPTLWKEGVGLLQQHEKKLWKEVQNDPLYANIKNNDDAIASEVLARLTGRENERFIAEVLDPKKKLNKLDKLTQQIKDWCTRMFTKVRSLFDTNNTKPLTLGEFVRMPLKAIWEDQEQSKFTKGVSAQFKNKKFKEQNSGMQSREQNFDAINSLNEKDQYIWKGDQSDTKMQEKSVQRPLNQQRAITILDGKYKDGKTINFTNEILDRKKKGETRTTKTLTRNEDLGITNDKQNVVGVIRLGDPRPLRKYDENGNKTQDYIDSMIEGTDYDIDDNNLDKDGKQKYFYPITVVRDYRNNPKKITKHVSQAYKEYDDTKFQENSTPKTYPDQNKDVYSVTFTKSAQRVGENQKKMAFYRKNDSYWRENKNKDGSITFTRKLPFRHHQRTLVYDDINGLTVGKKKKTKFREYYEAVKDQLIKWWFNDKHFLYKAAKNAGALNSYMRMMVMKDQGAVASAAIEDGIVKHNSKKGERTKSLNSIIEAVGEANQTDFLNYCEAFRILDLADRGFRQKMDKKLAEDKIKEVQNSKNAKLFEQQRQYFVEYNHELLWVLVDGGFITEEQYDKFIETDPNFIPLSKNMEELEDYVGGIGVSKKMINAEHPIHKIGTSMREVKNPFLEMQRRTVEYYVKASRNKAGRIFVDDIAGAIARGANGNVVAINQGMVRKLKSRDQNGNPISMDGKQNIFYVWNEGEKEYYQVADREIYEALRSFDSEQMGALKKIVDQTLGRTSRLVRNTATMTPDFGLRNLCRDNVEAFISSEHGFLPFIDAFWGMYQMANDTQWFREYQQMNGEPFNTLNREGEDVATVEHDVKDNIKIWKTYFPLIKKDFREFTDKNRSIPARAKSLLLLGTDVVGLHSLYKMNKKLNDYMEVGTRIGEYRNARMGYHGLYGRLFEGKVKGNRIFTNDKDLVYATNDELFSAYKSKDITLNFGQHGTIGKELNRIIPFFNASLQGIYKIGNTIDNMVHGDDNRIREELLFKCILMGAMGMAAALAGQGDDDYEEAPEYEHESFWILPNGIRIAKDQLFGRLVGNTFEKATRQYLKDGDVKKLEIVKDIVGNFMIDKCVPALIDLGWGTVGNYDSFRKQSVTPEYMAKRWGYLQKDLSTSKLGADISEAIFIVSKGFFGTPVDVGAKKIDFVISKTLSNLGKYATNLYELTGGNQKMTRGAEPEDKGGFAEWSKELPYPMNTIVGTFATNRNSFQSISDFYTRYRELERASSAPEHMSKEEKRAWTAYQEAYKQDKKFRDALKAIKQDKSLTGAQKRQKADKIFKQQINMARKLHDWEKKHGLV